jgi:formylmethanofuran dehydrogenase subunit E
MKKCKHCGQFFKKKELTYYHGQFLCADCLKKEKDSWK